MIYMLLAHLSVFYSSSTIINMLPLFLFYSIACMSNWPLPLDKQPRDKDSTIADHLYQAKAQQYNIFLCFTNQCEYFKESEAHLDQLTSASCCLPCYSSP